MGSDATVDLEPGDFVYQTDQELFLVCMGETETGYRFAVHGWREISDERLEGYLNQEHGKLHSQEQFETVVEEKGDEKVTEHYEELRSLFDAYKSGDADEDGPHTTFAMEDT